jgi:hypothetical protein
MKWLTLRPNAGCNSGEDVMAAELSPVETRAQDADLVNRSSLSGLTPRLPLRWPTPPGTPPSPKRSYRSHYVYLGWQDLRDPATWEQLSDFDLLLRLVDFEGLRPVLAQRLGWVSGRGWCPFDPVSMFLLQGWQITSNWNRAETLRNLHKPRYADYAGRFGFEGGVFPTEGGMRYFLTTLGHNSDASGETVVVGWNKGRCLEVAVQYLNQLIAASVSLIRDAGLLSPDAWQKALLCPDGMIHDAASRMRCSSVQASCYQPTIPQDPRPCPAKEKERRGCDCDTLKCSQMCRYATPRDFDARFVWYDGSNQPRSNPNQSTDPVQAKKKRGKGRYGYRSLPLQLADADRRFSIILLDDFQSANAHEENPTAALLRQLPSFYPDLHLNAVAGDAGFGRDVVLRAVYHLGAKRVIDLRAHATDKDKTQWPIRGYDDKGRPVCPFGYAFTANGFDSARQRYKWFCGQACLKGAQPLVSLDDVLYPPPECPFQDANHPNGRVINIGQRFADGSIRLARDVPVGTPTWKRLYHRARNAVEGRNAAFENWSLKRLRVYGLPRGKALTFLADVWLNLTTLARLVREATLASGFT